MPLRVLFLDLNAYFASVEQQDRPELRGRPVAVAPVEAETTACIAASAEAKRFGIRTGTRVADARRMCPGLVVVQARPELYVRTHHRILEAIDSRIPVARVWSIDEMECRLLGSEREPERARQIARGVKRAIRSLVGDRMTCSVGIAPNRLLAKVASDMEKPDGLVILKPEEVPGALLGLALRDLPGIGPRMERRLKEEGIGSVADVLARSEQDLVRIWGGVVGARWYRALRGEDLRDPRTRTRSLSHEHVLPPARRNESGARQVLVRLVHKGAARLRGKRMVAGSLSVHAVIRSGGRWEARAAVGAASADTLTLCAAMLRVWDQGIGERRNRSIVRVGVVFTELEGVGSATLPLFAERRADPRLGRAIDRINDRYGRNTIYSAAMHAARAAAPMRIAFQSVPDLRTSV
ncbi:MAG: DNA polymerase [Phycisphaerae bacterium]|nr:DNA polymerase [Phycisphaerae bacterium]